MGGRERDGGEGGWERGKESESAPGFAKSTTYDIDTMKYPSST